MYNLPRRDLADALMSATRSSTPPLYGEAAPRSERGTAPMSLVVTFDRGAQCLKLAGELDYETVPILAAVASSLRDGPHASSTVDISGLTFLDAAGIGWLVAFANERAVDGSTISIVGTSPRVRQDFELVQLDAMLCA